MSLMEPAAFAWRRIESVGTIAAVAAALLIAGCSTGTAGHMASTMSGSSAASTSSAISGMPGMTGQMPAGDGLSASQSGFTLVHGTTTLTANIGNTFTFRITAPDG